ncbi:calcium-binding protein [Falsiroseomonas sp. HC035]|uniref:calcium-binding protein n=1 Tax=Falsiroseomonas sp. HC035 TaxID=3390999 RepID=UPI003D3230C7
MTDKQAISDKELSIVIGGVNRTGGDGRDTLEGTSNNDSLMGGGGDDFLNSGNSQDTLDGEGGNDVILAGDGDDRARGGAGSDVIYGGAGQDRLYGNAGNDELNGDGGDDTLIGGTGADLINGGQGGDTIVWSNGAGNDTIDGGPDNDVLTLQMTNETLDRAFGVSLNGMTSSEVLNGIISKSGVFTPDPGSSMPTLRGNYIDLTGFSGTITINHEQIRVTNLERLYVQNLPTEPDAMRAEVT